MSPISVNYSLQVCTITAAEWISKFTRSRCGEMVELQCWQPIITSPPYVAWHQKGILQTEQFWLGERSEMVSEYALIIPAVMNHSKCLDLWMLRKSVWDQEVGKRDCVLHIMRWCLSTLGSPKYMRPAAESISVIPVSPYVYTQRDWENSCHITT